MKKLFLVITCLVSSNIFAAQAAGGKAAESDCLGIFPLHTAGLASHSSHSENASRLHRVLNWSKVMAQKEYDDDLPFYLSCVPEVREQLVKHSRFETLLKEDDSEEYKYMTRFMSAPLPPYLLVIGDKQLGCKKIEPEGTHKLGIILSKEGVKVECDLYRCNPHILAVCDDKGHSGSLIYNPGNNLLTLRSSLFNEEAISILRSSEKEKREWALWQSAVALLGAMHVDGSKKYIFGSSHFSDGGKGMNINSVLLNKEVNQVVRDTGKECVATKIFGVGTRELPELEEEYLRELENETTQKITLTNCLLAAWFLPQCEQREDGSFDFGKTLLEKVPYYAHLYPSSKDTRAKDALVEGVDCAKIKETGN